MIREYRTEFMCGNRVTMPKRKTKKEIAAEKAEAKAAKAKK